MATVKVKGKKPVVKGVVKSVAKPVAKAVAPVKTVKPAAPVAPVASVGKKVADKPKMTAMNFLSGLSGEERPVIRIALDNIEPDPNQPRQTWRAADGIVPMEAQVELENLAASIREQDVIQPIIVREIGQGKYMIIAGERRWRASRLAGKADVPAIVRQDVSAMDVEMIQLTENVQRESMSDLDTAKHVKKMLEKYPLLQKKNLAAMLNKHPSYVSRMMAFADERWAHVVDTGLITYASVLEQFAALPQTTQQKLLDSAKGRGSSIKAADVHAAKRGVKGEEEAGGGVPDGDGDGEGDGGGAGGAQDDFGRAVEAVLSKERVPGEAYTRQPEEVISTSDPQGLRDSGAELVNGLPTTPNQVVIRDQLSNVQEVRLSLGQLARLVSAVEVDEGAPVTIALGVELMRGAIEALGGKVPDDVNWMQMALVESLK